MKQSRPDGTASVADVLHDPFVRILRRWAGIEEAEAEVAVRTRLRGRLSLLGVEAAAAAFPALAHLVGLPPATEEEHALRLLPPERLGAELRAGYRAWVAALAERAPLALVLDDLHWADSGTGRLFEELLELARGVAPPALPVEPGRGLGQHLGAGDEELHRGVARLEPLEEPFELRLAEDLDAL